MSLWPTLAKINNFLILSALIQALFGRFLPKIGLWWSVCAVPVLGGLSLSTGGSRAPCLSTGAAEGWQVDL
jgi:hypothetical protein